VIRLTSAEIAALWTTFIECSATNCFYKHFLQHLKDNEIKPLVEEALFLNEEYMSKIKKIFTDEDFPIPIGFSDNDINFNAPALYTDLFSLSFVYRGGQMITSYYATILGKVARDDIYAIFNECLNKTTKLYKKSLDVMLGKGVYDRPPYMEYPKEVVFIQHQPSLLNTWFGEGRPLNALELGELFFAIERNSIGLILLIGLIQVSKDKEIKEYFLKGKKLSEKQIETFNKILKNNESFPTFPVTMEVTDSTISPFSDRLMMFFINSSNQIGLSTLGYAISVSMRKDLAIQYSLFMAEIMQYGNDGLNILIKRGWMEQPPQTIDRKNMYK
jgi:hypothetical protein